MGTPLMWKSLKQVLPNLNNVKGVQTISVKKESYTELKDIVEILN